MHGVKRGSRGHGGDWVSNQVYNDNSLKDTSGIGKFIRNALVPVVYGGDPNRDREPRNGRLRLFGYNMLLTGLLLEQNRAAAASSCNEDSIAWSLSGAGCHENDGGDHRALPGPPMAIGLNGTGRQVSWP